MEFQPTTYKPPLLLLEKLNILNENYIVMCIVWYINTFSPLAWLTPRELLRRILVSLAVAINGMCGQHRCSFGKPALNINLDFNYLILTNTAGVGHFPAAIYYKE